MKKQMVDDYYTSRKAKLLKDFDKAAKRLRKILVSYYGDDLTDTIARETRQEYEALIPELPYIGGKKNLLTRNLIGSAQALALYRVLKRHGKTVEEAGKIIYEAVEAQIGAYPRLLLCLLGKLRFTKFVVKKLRKLAAESQKRRYPGDWVCTFVEGDGEEFDFGIDYTECGICKFYHAQGADEFTPFLCLTDFPLSKAFGSGLARTMTIAEGCDKCDFRWKRGREVKQGWPPEFLNIQGFKENV
jgi:hypothetical protein